MTGATATSGPRFGVVVVQNLPWPRWRDRVLQVETLGYDAVYVWDHLLHRTQRRDDPLFDGMTALAAAAEFTERVKLGTMVAAPIHRHPLVLANQAMTIDRISGGRLELGIGAGGAVLDHEALGIPTWEPREQVGRFRETVELVDRVLRAGDATSSYAGEWYEGDEMTVAPGPVQTPRPHLTLAAHGPQTIGIAARHADEWNSSTPRDRDRDEAVALMAERVRILERAAVEADRDPSEIRRSVMLGSDLWPALASPEAVRDAVLRLTEVGITDFVLIHPDHPAEEALGHGRSGHDVVRRLAEDVLPDLRAELA